MEVKVDVNSQPAGKATYNASKHCAAIIEVPCEVLALP